MTKTRKPCIYFDKKRNTFYFKKYYYDALGSRQQVFRRGFKSLADAEKYMIDFLANHTNDCNMSFIAVVNNYINYCQYEKNLRDSTLNTRKFIINKHILHFFNNKPIAKIHQRDIIAWHQHLKRDLPNLADTYLYSISKNLIFIFKYAVNILDLKNNVAEKCGCIGHARTKRDVFWTLNDFNVFLNVLNNIKLNKDNHITRKIDNFTLTVAFKILFYLGIRIGELLGLTIDSFDQKNKTITIKQQYQNHKFAPLKSQSSYRTLPVCKTVYNDLCVLLNKMADSNPNQRIFAAINDSNLRRALNSSAELAGIQCIRIHDLRHSCSALLFSKGATALEVQKYLGHAKIATTQDYYGHVYHDDLINIANLLDK